MLREEFDFWALLGVWVFGVYARKRLERDRSWRARVLAWKIFLRRRPRARFCGVVVRVFRLSGRFFVNKNRFYVPLRLPVVIRLRLWLF